MPVPQNSLFVVEQASLRLRSGRRLPVADDNRAIPQIKRLGNNYLASE